jgi:hypothetical protein
MRIRIRLFTLMTIRIWIQILASKKRLKSLNVIKFVHIPHILACHLHIGADPDPNFYLMRIRILNFFDADADPDPVYKNYADPDPLHCLKPFLYCLARIYLFLLEEE